ncbi:MAG: glycosyltransferase family 4 protein [Gemmatimonadota bacterium]
MRILHTLAPAPVGGLERVVQMLAKAQSAAGHDVAVLGVVSPTRDSHPFFAAFDDSAVDARPLVVPDREWIRELRALATELRRWRPEIVHTHGYRSDVLMGRTARRAGVPTVATAHGFIGGGLKNRLYEWLQTASYRRGTHAIAVSRPLGEELVRRGVPASRLHLVPNAWAPDGSFLEREAARRALGLDGPGPIVGWVGRVSREKGADVAVEALTHLPDVRLSIVGDGAMRGELEQCAKEQGTTDRIRWHGWRSRADLMLRAFDVLVLSSRTEGTPIIVLEALAAGVPLVVTRVGGVPDVVRHDREALLVPSEDPVELARAVQACLDDPTSARARVARGRSRVETEFGVDSWVARHERVYEAANGKGGA